MFYFKWTVDKRLDSLHKRIDNLEKENNRLKTTLKDQGIISSWYITNSSSPNLKNLDRDFKMLLKYLDLCISTREPLREIVEFKKECEKEENDS